MSPTPDPAPTGRPGQRRRRRDRHVPDQRRAVRPEACGATTTTKKVWAATTGRAVERGQHPRTARLAAKTLRTDNWWLRPCRNRHRPCCCSPSTRRSARSSSIYYYSAPYLSPFYSPCLTHRLRAGGERLRPADQLVATVPGADHPDLPAGLPADLLLLPQGLLPRVLVLAAGLRGRRAAQAVHRRDPVPADPAEHPPLLLVRRRWSSA